LIAVVIAVLSFSLGSILSRRTLPLAPGFPGYASGLVCAGLLLLAVSALAGEAPAWPPQPVALAAWWYLVLVGSVIAFSAYMTLLSTTSTALASSWTFVAPVVGTLLGISLGGESVTGSEWTAIGVIILGVTVLVLGRKDRAARVPCHK
ncbi:MAG TPA: EamA family transporter, partial [Steroidobacteraceae bacterium]|nr:EamA family transporter [Steroidobacteraceae bacterium]